MKNGDFQSTNVEGKNGVTTFLRPEKNIIFRFTQFLNIINTNLWSKAIYSKGLFFLMLMNS